MSWSGRVHGVSSNPQSLAACLEIARRQMATEFEELRLRSRKYEQLTRQEHGRKSEIRKAQKHISKLNDQLLTESRKFGNEKRFFNEDLLRLNKEQARSNKVHKLEIAKLKSKLFKRSLHLERLAEREGLQDRFLSTSQLQDLAAKLVAFDCSTKERLAAVQRLAPLGYGAEHTLKSLKAATNDFALPIRIAALQALENFGPEAKSAVDTLIESWATPIPWEESGSQNREDYERAFLLTLGAIGRDSDRARALLTRAAFPPGPPHRRLAAIAALGRFAQGQAFRITGLKDRDRSLDDLLDRHRLDLDFDQTPIEKTFQFMEEVTGIPITMSEETRARLAEEKATVTLRLRSISAKTSLKLITDVLSNLSFVVQEGTLIIRFKDDKTSEQGRRQKNSKEQYHKVLESLRKAARDSDKAIAQSAQRAIDNAWNAYIKSLEDLGSVWAKRRAEEQQAEQAFRKRWEKGRFSLNFTGTPVDDTLAFMQDLGQIKIHQSYDFRKLCEAQNPTITIKAKKVPGSFFFAKVVQTVEGSAYDLINDTVVLRAKDESPVAALAHPSEQSKRKLKGIRKVLKDLTRTLPKHLITNAQQALVKLKKLEALQNK